MRKLLTIFIAFLLGGCLGIPEGVRPVDNFELDRYLGTWYEIARLDHRFERGLQKVHAEYIRREGGGVKVVNRGYAVKEKQWKEITGKAFFARDEDEGYLKVSFFGPFYSSYVIFELDKKNYQHAFVAGYDKDYLWLLARTPTVSRDVVDHFIKRSRELGFDTENLIMVEHDEPVSHPVPISQ